MTASTREEDGGADCIRSEQVSDHVLLIRFDRYAKRNALTNAMVIEIARLLKEAKDDKKATIRGLLLSHHNLRITCLLMRRRLWRRI